MSIKKPASNIENESEQPTTQQIPIEDHADEQQNMDVDFQDETLANQYATKSTKPSEDKSPKAPDDMPAEKIAQQLQDYENSKTAKLTYADLNKFAEWIVNLIDTTVSSALKWVARDNSRTAYEMPATSKKMLTEQLAIILSRYQHKFRVEFIFFIGLMMVYSTPVYAAIQNRKRNPIAQRREKQIDKKVNEAVTQQKQNETLNEQIPEEKPIESVEQTIIKENINIPRKRSQGRPRKISR